MEGQQSPTGRAAFSAQQIFNASLLTGFFEAGWSIQVLLGDMDRRQYEASRLARPEIERHLLTMSNCARDLPPDLRARMPRVDWSAWVELASSLPPVKDLDRAKIWTVISEWLPPAGAEMRRYRAQMPELWAFKA